MPNEMGTIAMAFVWELWFLAVLLVVGALVWRQAHPKQRHTNRR